MSKEANEGLRRHKLLTAELRKQLPKLYSTEHTPTNEKIVITRFFSIANHWSWYPVEFDGVDTFFGFVDGWEPEWGYFSLSELAELTFQNGVPAVERDLYFRSAAVSDVPQIQQLGLTQP